MPGAHEARFVERALAELADGPDPAEEAHLRAEIADVVATFTGEWRMHDERARIGTVSDQLARIEAACTALAQAFDEASYAALAVFHGHGVGNLPVRLSSPEAGREFGALRVLADRYHVPYGPSASAEALADSLRPREGRDLASDARLLDWPTAARALGAAAQIRRESYEAQFRATVARADAILEHGPDGALRPPPGKGTGRTRARRNALADRGGQENASDLMRGNPKWVLARECYELLALRRPGEDLPGTRGGRVYRFTLAVYGLATGEDVEECQRGGGAYDAGLARHVQAAARIGKALGRLRAQLDHAGPLAPFTADERRREASLARAWETGRVPRWLA